MRKILGTTDEITTCDMCGREELSRTVVIDHLDADGNSTNERGYYGSDCASKVFLGKKTAAGIRKEARDADEKARMAAYNAKRAADNQRFLDRHAGFYAWITETYGVKITSHGDIADNRYTRLGGKGSYQLKDEYNAR